MNEITEIESHATKRGGKRAEAEGGLGGERRARYEAIQERNKNKVKGGK